MINFVLPDFYYNIGLINFLSDAVKYETDAVKIPVNISSASGNFPFAIWNGQYNIVQGNTNNIRYFPLKKDYQINKKIGIPIRLNCSNVCIDESMYNDAHMDVILKECDNMSNYIEISNLDLYGYIHERYPNYRFIFSHNADLIHPFNIDLINNFTTFEQLEKIQLPIRFIKDFEFLKQIQNKQKIELPVNSLCPASCLSYNECRIRNDEQQINYSGQNIFKSCNITPDYEWNLHSCISLEKIKETYEPLGFHHFYFASVANTENFNRVLFFFHYFFKEEYAVDMLKEFNKREGLFT